jgi:hypothetical protein
MSLPSSPLPSSFHTHSPQELVLELRDTDAAQRSIGKEQQVQKLISIDTVEGPLLAI